MGEEVQIDATISKLEQELQKLKYQLENNAATAAAADESQLDPEQQPPDEQPVAAFFDWSQQQAALDAELEQQLRARLSTSDEITAELERHVSALERVMAERRHDGLDAGVLRQRIAQRHHEQRRLFSAVRREINSVLRTIHNRDGYMSIQLLLDQLFERFTSAPHDPYVPVSRHMLPEHLAMLERAGIVRYHSGTGEQRVRMVDLAANLRTERIVPERSGRQTARDGDETDES